jgi:hypothetical protein
MPICRLTWWVSLTAGRPFLDPQIGRGKPEKYTNHLVCWWFDGHVHFTMPLKLPRWWSMNQWKNFGVISPFSDLPIRTCLSERALLIMVGQFSIIPVEVSRAKASHG